MTTTMQAPSTSVCDTCGEDFPTGRFIAHKITRHPRGKTTRTQDGPHVPEGFLAQGYHHEGTTPAQVRRSPVREAAAKSQVKTPRVVTTPTPSARSERADTRRATPAKVRALRAELRQARKAMRELQARLDAS